MIECNFFLFKGENYVGKVNKIRPQSSK